MTERLGIRDIIFGLLLMPLLGMIAGQMKQYHWASLVAPAARKRGSNPVDLTYIVMDAYRLGGAFGVIRVLKNNRAGYYS